MARPVQLETSADSIEAETPRPEKRLRESVATLECNGKLSVASKAEQLAILKRWYYRSSRVGEIFLREPDADWPWRRILNGVSRVFVGEKQSAEPQRAQSHTEGGKTSSD